MKRHRDEVARLSLQLAHWKAQAETQTLASYHLQETLEDVKKLVEVSGREWKGRWWEEQGDRSLLLTSYRRCLRMWRRYWR